MRVNGASMNLLTIPLRNLNRKFLRTILLICVFTLGILCMVSINKVSKVIGEGLERKLNQFGANILVYPVTETLDVSYGGFDLGSLSYDVKYLDEVEVMESIRNIELRKNISAVAPKLIAVEGFAGQRAVLVGVNWEEELKLKSYWAWDGRLPENGSDILLGSKLAQHLGLKAEQMVTIGNSEYLVTGVLETTGSSDDSVAFMDLHQLQNLTGKENSVNFVEVSALCSGCPIEDIVTQINRKLPGTDIRTVQSAVQQRLSAVGFVQKLARIVSVVLLLTASFMIALFMVNAVNERKKEIGVLRSMGYSRFKVFSIFCFEALVIGFISGVLGYVTGFFVSFRMLELLEVVEHSHITFDVVQFIATLLFMVVVSTTASVLPAWKATRIEPTEALIAL
jgi:putative ABC transport system permease protein